MTLKWVCHYERYSTLSTEFGISPTLVSLVIHEMLPYIAFTMNKHIPHRQMTTQTSVLSKNLVYIIDGTIHPIAKPKANQHLFYRADKQCHFIQSMLLVDFEGWIIAFSTNYQGHNSDSACARQNSVFRAIIGKQYALGDPGFGNVSYVIPGLRCNQLHSQNHESFDIISRQEQKRIEWVNNFFKRVKTVAKSTVFMHGRAAHVYCILIACGLYNWKKQLGQY